MERKHEQKMKLKTILISLLLIASCQKSIEDQVITKEGIKEVYGQFESKERLKDLYNIAQGRNAFIKATGINEQMVRDSARFEQVANQLFSYYETKGITYKILINEVDSMKKYGKDGCSCPIVKGTTPIVDKFFVLME